MQPTGLFGNANVKHVCARAGAQICGRVRRLAGGNPALMAFCAALFFALSALGGPSLTLAQLRNDPSLTPERFMSYFRDFDFKLVPVLQSPDAFLAAKAGDCADFASLADEVFRQKHYTTELIAVFMNGQTHVVCYLKEAHGYLDYNRRREVPGLQPSDGSLEDIANQVAAYFRTNWSSAAVFKYENNYPEFGNIVFR